MFDNKLDHFVDWTAHKLLSCEQSFLFDILDNFHFPSAEWDAERVEKSGENWVKIETERNNSAKKNFWWEMFCFLFWLRFRMKKDQSKQPLM